MKGKEAVAAANRRANEASAQVDALQRELAALRASSKDKVHELEEQVRQERANHLREAARIASVEVARQIAERERARREAGISDDIAIHMLYRNDKFIHNACRYVSMTTGAPPIDALAVVLTWRTEEDVEQMPRVEQLIELGVAADGWVSRQLKNLTRGWRKTSHYRNLAMSLDRAEAEGHSRIHPKYRPEWYAQGFTWQGIQLVDENAGDRVPVA